MISNWLTSFHWKRKFVICNLLEVVDCKNARARPVDQQFRLTDGLANIIWFFHLIKTLHFRLDEMSRSWVKGTVDNSEMGENGNDSLQKISAVYYRYGLHRSMGCTTIFTCACVRCLHFKRFPKKISKKSIHIIRSQFIHLFAGWFISWLLSIEMMFNGHHRTVAVLKMLRDSVRIRCGVSFVSVNFSPFRWLCECVWFSGRWNDLITIESICFNYWTCWNRTGVCVCVCACSEPVPRLKCLPFNRR